MNKYLLARYAINFVRRDLSTATKNVIKSPRKPVLPAEELSTSHIDQILVQAPQLRQYDHGLWKRTFCALANQGFTPDGFVNIISQQPSLLTRQPDQIVQTVECWRSTQFGDHRVLELLERYPELFDFRDERMLLHRLAFLKLYVATAKNVWRLFMNSPNTITERETSLEAKIEYLQNTMRAEVSDVVKSSVFSHQLDSIRTRHTFLDRLGLFKPRSPKADPKDPNRNPRMHQIFDTSDKEFASKVCGVSLEEWEVFQALFAKELAKESKVAHDLDEQF